MKKSAKRPDRGTAKKLIIAGAFAAASLIGVSLNIQHSSTDASANGLLVDPPFIFQDAFGEPSDDSNMPSPYMRGESMLIMTQDDCMKDFYKNMPYYESIGELLARQSGKNVDVICFSAGEGYTTQQAIDFHLKYVKDSGQADFYMYALQDQDREESHFKVRVPDFRRPDKYVDTIDAHGIDESGLAVGGISLYSHDMSLTWWIPFVEDSNRVDNPDPVKWNANVNVKPISHEYWHEFFFNTGAPAKCFHDAEGEKTIRSAKTLRFDDGLTPVEEYWLPWEKYDYSIISRPYCAYI